MHWNIKTFYPGGFLKRCMFVSCMKNSTALWSPFVRQIGTSWTGTGSIVGIGPVLRQGQASSVGIWPVHGTGTGLFWPFPVPVGQVWYKQRPTETSTTCSNLPVPQAGFACPSGTCLVQLPPFQSRHSIKFRVVPYEKTKGVLIDFCKFFIKNRSQIGQKSRLLRFFFH